MADDWRLEADLDTAIGDDALDDVIDHLHADAEVGAAVTHDEGRVFAYAASREALDAVRGRVEAVLAADGVRADVRISAWNDEIGTWLQVEPPLDEIAQEATERALADAEEIVTRTGVVDAGRLTRENVEQAMRASAADLGLECAVEEHRHLLTVQLAFTVTGPLGRVNQFLGGLAEEGLLTIRTESGIFRR